MARKRRTKKIKDDNNVNNIKYDSDEEKEEATKDYIYFKSQYKEHQEKKINELTKNFIKCNIIKL